jgi:hypothetical protein
MKKKFALLAATAAFGLATSAYAADDSAQTKSNVEYKNNGGYEASRSAERTTTDGTTNASESKVDVSVDSNGNATKTEQTETSTDPKGLMNKKEDQNKTKFSEKENGGYTQTTTSKHKDADGTDVTLTTTTDVDIDKDGNVVTSAKTKKTVDPKGLFNSKTTTTKTKTINGRVVEQRKKVD